VFGRGDHNKRPSQKEACPKGANQKKNSLAAPGGRWEEGENEGAKETFPSLKLRTRKKEFGWGGARGESSFDPKPLAKS